MLRLGGLRGSQRRGQVGQKVVDVDVQHARESIQVMQHHILPTRLNVRECATGHPNALGELVLGEFKRTSAAPDQRPESFVKLAIRVVHTSCVEFYTRNVNRAREMCLMNTKNSVY